MTTKTLLLAATLFTTAGTASAQLTFEFLKIAEAGDTPLGSPGPLDGSFNDPAVDDQGNVAFEGDTDNAGGVGFEDAVVRWSNGVLTQVHREDSVVPGTSVLDGRLDDHVEIRNGIAGFKGVVDPRGADEDFIATSDGVTSRIVAQAGTTALPSQGSPLVTDLGTSEGWGFDGVRVAFSAQFNGGQGVYFEDGFVGLTKIADTNDPTPDGLSYARFGDAMPDANGPGVVFSADVFDNQNNFGEAIYVASDGSSGTLTSVVNSLTIPLASPEVDQVQIGEPDIDAGRVVFRTAQFDFDAPFGSTDRDVAASIELWENGALRTLVDLGAAFPNGLMPLSFADAAIAGDYVAFTAFDGAANGLLLYDVSDDSLYSVIQPGDVVDGRTVIGVDSYNRPFLSDGYLALELNFAGGDSAIYRVAIVPEPSSIAILAAAGLGCVIFVKRRLGSLR